MSNIDQPRRPPEIGPPQPAVWYDEGKGYQWQFVKVTYGSGWAFETVRPVRHDVTPLLSQRWR